MLADAWKSSAPLVFTAIYNHVPFCIFGVSPSGVENVGSIWMLGTDGVVAARHYLQRFTASWVDWMNLIYPHLTNSCLETNTVTRRWLEYAGFEFGEPFPHPETGQSFLPFWRNL